MKPFKIYFDNFPLIVSDHYIPELDTEDTLLLKKRKKAVALLKEHLSDYRKAFIQVKKYPKAMEKIFRDYNTVVAGGGLVRNQKGEILLIYRKGHWDMAKGHLERGETIEECAIREVSEETGLKEIKLIRPLGITYHTYFRKRNILKENHWYLMESTSGEPLVPQEEEGVKRVKWVPTASIDQYYDTMFPSIKDIIRVFLGELSVILE